MNLDSAIFYSNDIEKVIPFYRDTLGFTLDYQTERFVSFIFPNGRLGIKNQTEEREKPGYQTVFISVKNIEIEYEKIIQKGITLRTKLEEKPWGKEFSFLDLDGNKILYLEHPEKK